MTFTPAAGQPSPPGTLLMLQSTENVAIQTGDYDVTIDSGDGCQEIPDGLSVRTYTATLSMLAPGDASGAQYLVKLAGQFLDPGYDPTAPPGGFHLWVLGHDFGMPNMDGDILPLAWEKVTPTVLLQIGVSGAPIATAAGPSASSFTLPVYKTFMDYCEVPAGGDLSSACTVPGFVRHASCTGHNGRVTFMHR